MSWNVISNSSLLRVDSFKYKSLDSDSVTSSQENFAPELLEYMNRIFTSLDVGRTGFIKVDDLDRYWKCSKHGFDPFLKSHYGISSANVTNLMRQVTPQNGMFNFRGFIRGMKMAVSRAKNERLRRLSGGSTSKMSGRAYPLGNRSTNGPGASKVKSDAKPVHRASSTTERKVMELVKRLPGVTRKSVFSPLSDDESTVNETKELPSFSSTELCPDSKIGKSLALDSFISASDTVDYSAKTPDDDASSVASSHILRENSKQKRNFGSKDLGSFEAGKRSDDPKYQGFRKTSLDKVVSQVSDKIRMMQRCVDAADNIREWYVRKISALQQNRMDLRRAVFLGRTENDTDARVSKMKDNWDSFNYQDIKRFVDTISYYNNNLQGSNEKQGNQGSTSPGKSTTTLILEKMVEGQARQIKQLEGDKAALVKDLFLMKGKLNIVEKPVDQVVPF